MKVGVYMMPGSGRSEKIAAAMIQGILRCGDNAREVHMLQYRRPEFDVAVFYGLMRNVLDGYRNAGRPAIYVDLGYWGRQEGGRREGYHKFAMNARHPTKYFQKKKHTGDRFSHFRLKIHPWRGGNKNGYIMLAGMSAKAANAEGFQPEAWETRIVQEIRRHTDREIIYRPKPNWADAKPIPGTHMVRGLRDEGDVYKYLDRCHAVVTHHSNVAVDALLYGVPVFCWDGIATAPGQASQNLSLIEKPPAAVNREQWAYDAAWTQWSVREMLEGRAWRYLKNEVLNS